MTWIERDGGVRVLTLTCSCGRGVYLRPRGNTYGGAGPSQCMGCGNAVELCWCPEVPRVEAT